MKHIQLGAKVLMVVIMLAVILNRTSGIDTPLWLAFIIGCLTVVAFWESE